MNVTHKLEYFSKAALEDATRQRDAIRGQMDREMEKSLDAVRREAAKQAQARLQSERYKAEQLKNREAIKASAEAKKSLIGLRRQLTGQLFQRVAGRISQFTASTGYTDYLEKDIRAAMSRYQTQQEPFRILLTARDMALAAELSLRLNLARDTFQESREDFAGGFKLHLTGKNALEDHSFLSRLEEERANFTLFKTDVKEAL